MANLQDRLKILREKYGYTQEELAQKVGLTKNAVSLYEHGKRKPSIETLEAFSDIFNVSIDYLTGASETTEVIPDVDFFLNDEERNLIIEYRNIDSSSRDMINRMLAYAKEMKKKS